MDLADSLIDMIFSWVDLQKQCADKLEIRATELEENKKTVNVTKVIGSSVSVGGAAAVLGAGAVTLLTGGLAIPFLGTAGAVVGTIGLVTTVGAEVVDNVVSISTMKEAQQISENSENVKKEIQKLMESLAEEGKNRKRRAGGCSDVSPQDYIVEQILRAMAKRSGLILKDKINLTTLVSDLSVKKISGKDTDLDFLKQSPLEVPLLSEFVGELASDVIIKAGTKKAGKEVIKKGVSSVATTVGLTTTAKAVGRVGGGAVGLLFSVPELITNCQNLDKCETEVSKNLRAMAAAMKTTSAEMERELDEIKKLCRKLADKKCCKKYLKKSSRSRRRWKNIGRGFQCFSSSKTNQ